MVDPDPAPAPAPAPAVATDTVYRVNAPAVVSETIDDEVVIINLDTGTYFTVDGAGVVAWQALERGATPGRVIEMVHAAHAGADQSVVATAINSLLSQALAEDLLRALEPDEADAIEPLVVSHPSAPAEFIPPVLESYIDMQTLIQLDPILEVDEQGYPRTPEP